MTTIKRFLRPDQVRELILVLLIVLVVAFFGTQIDGYISGRTFNRISTSVAIITVVAVGQTLVVLTRNIDLSVGSIVGFCAYFVGTQYTNNNDIHPLLGVGIAVGVGAFLGAINGLLIAYGRIPAIIVTLGTLAIYRGYLVDFSGAKTVTTANLPDWLSSLSRVNMFTLGDVEVRLMVGLAVIVVVVFQLVLRYLPFGRRLYAIGSNPEAARVAGLPSRRIVFLAYVLCGALAGLAGFMFLVRFGDITVVAALGMELQVVAAVVVGGVNIFGGSGTMIGAMLGAVIIGTLEQSLIRLNINEFWKDGLLGLFILLAVASDSVILNRLRNVWGRSELQLTSGAEVAQLPEKGETLAMAQRSIWERLRSWEVLLLVILLVTIVINVSQSPVYASIGNIVNLFQLHSEKIIVAMIMTFVIINGEIDLSVASIMGLSACVLAALYEAGTSVPVAIVVALLSGLLAGAFNGFWIAYVGLPSLAVTLAGLIGFRGIARILIEDRSIGDFPDWFDNLGQQPLVGPFPLALIIFFVFLAIAVVVLQYTSFGRYVYVIGNNAEAARFSGIKVKRVKMTLYIVSGLVSALAGILIAARLGAVRGNTGEGFELDIITMVLLGGVSIFGGTGTLTGVGLSILIILNLRNGMGLANVTGNVQTSVIGLLLILSVLIPNLARAVQQTFRRQQLYTRSAETTATKEDVTQAT